MQCYIHRRWPPERDWIELTVKPSELAFNSRIEEREKSRHLDFKRLGIPLTRNDALASPLRDEFFEVADHIVERVPSVRSYLEGRKLITSLFTFNEIRLQLKGLIRHVSGQVPY